MKAAGRGEQSSEEEPSSKESPKAKPQDMSHETIAMITREVYKVMSNVWGSRKSRKHQQNKDDEDPEERDILLVSLASNMFRKIYTLRV